MKNDKQRNIKGIYNGSIRTNGKGYGFFRTPKINSFVEVSPIDLNTALDLDTVEVEVVGRSKYGDLKGKVKKIIKRNKDTWVGIVKKKYLKKEKKYFFHPDDFRFYPDVEIINIDQFKDLKEDDKVALKMITWTSSKRPVRMKIISVLGKIGDNETEMKAAVMDKGLSFSFPKEVEKAAKELKIKSKKLIADEIPKRKDLRHLNVFTIDPADAKDFDDAISVEKLDNGNYSIGVHIADPTFFVTPNSVIDKEARKRATSIYLVDRTIPMLPEVLSNDLCSLNPNEEKLAFSCVFEMDKDANVIKEWFGKTIIISKRRFNYIEAQGILDKKEGEYYDDLKILSELSDKMNKDNLKGGAIEFSSVEVKFKLDEKKFPIDIYIKPHVHTMEIIEEFALLANKRISIYASLDKEGRKTDNPFIYRIHEKPKPEKIADVIKFLSKFNYNPDVNGDGNLSSKEINKILDAHKGKAEENLISLSILRSMQKAVYSTVPKGHYGLGFAYYSHFTSPIRRYPDMIAHRFLLKYLEGKKVDKKLKEEIQIEAIHSSEMEQKAVDAERQSIKFKYTQYYSKRVGEDFFGMIVNITKNGFFVEHLKTKASGFVSIRETSADWVFSEEDMTIKNKRTKKIYSIGQSVKTIIKEVDLIKMRIDLELV